MKKKTVTASLEDIAKKFLYLYKKVNDDIKDKAYLVLHTTKYLYLCSNVSCILSYLIDTVKYLAFFASIKIKEKRG